MTPATLFPSRRLKYAATINDEALSESTDSDFELAYIDIGNVDSQGRVHDIVNYRFGDAPSRARRIVRDGDVIISTVRTYLQAIAPVENPPENLIVSTGFAVVRPLGVLDHRFCKYALRASPFLWEVESRSTGVSYPAVNASDLGDIKVSLPELRAQRLIANYLDRETARIDGLIAEKERMLALLEEKRAALISRVVTRGLDPNALLKPSGQEWLGEIPAHWEIRRCATLFAEIDERNHPDLPLLNVSLNTGVTLRVFSDERIESVAADFSTYKVARQGDLVFNKMRFWQGAGGIAPEDGLTSPDYTVARFGGALYPEYVELLMRLPLFSNEVRRYSYGMVDDRLRLYWDAFKNLRIPVPPVAEQKRIAIAAINEAREIAELGCALARSIALAKERRAALITAAVTGQIPLEEMRG
ncbi:MAG: restriction endonuclease subunit S [Chromatiaceae bacterium]|nr:restriction endonuclease subunit S [Chromatiaceae bacterium]